MTSARAQTVNSHRITVSKLSRLQKLILQEIKNFALDYGSSPGSSDGRISLTTLSSEVADKYEPCITESTRLREEAPEDEVVAGVRRKLRLPKRTLPPNHEIGNTETGYLVLSPKFKASFYRSLRRLEDRGLIARGLKFYEDQGRRVTFTTIILTESGKAYCASTNESEVCLK